MTVDQSAVLRMLGHTWELSSSGAVIRHRVDQLDELRMVENPETARQAFIHARGEYQGEVAKTSRMRSHRKVAILLINSILCIVASTPFSLLPELDDTWNMPVFWVFIIALFLLFFFNTTVTDVIRAEPDKELKLNIKIISEQLNRHFPITASPEHPDAFMRHMRPIDAKAVIDSYRMVDPLAVYRADAPPEESTGPYIVSALDTAYHGYDKQLVAEELANNQQQKHQLAVDARKIIDSLELPDHPTARPED